MTIVDHRVLVNAPPEVAWQLLGDLNALPKWHINCTATSMLTTQHEGVGVRRRNTMRGGPDVVEEIISWYPNLGFEYVIVDGPRYHSNRGRIRLQPIPEGTVIQWTFEYQLGGFLSGLRDTFHRRRLNDELARSLRRFKQLVESSGVRMDPATIDRVSMRAAPSAAERAAIGEAATRARQQRVPAPEVQPSTPPEPTVSRMPPALPETPPQPIQVVPEPADSVPVKDGPPAIPAIPEPPLSDEDTRPRQPVSAEAPAAPAEAATEPEEELFDLDAPPAWMRPDDDEEPPVEAVDVDAPDTVEDKALPEIDEHEADTITEAPTEPDREPPALATPPSDTMASESMTEATPPELSEEVVESEASQPEESAVEESAAPPVEASDLAPTPPTPPVTAEPEDPASPPTAAPDASLLDHEASPAGPSIWEVFGIAPPSEGAPGSAAAEPAPPAETAPQAIEAAAPSPAPPKRGVRRRPVIRARAFQRAQGLRLRLNQGLARRLRHRIKKAGS